jgi:amidophosphoribosyltransferase
VVVDDSIVRGNTQRALVRMLREAGATEVHIRISSPPVKWPCFFGIDFASRAELIANGLSVEEIRRSLGADSLAYISLEGMIAATHVPGERLCRACFDGMYPLKLPEPELLGKHLLERVPAPGHRGHAQLRRPSRRGPAEARPDPDEAERAQAPPATQSRAPMPGAARD